MLSRRWRPVIFCLIAVLAVWVAAIIGFRIARNSKVTAEKVEAYLSSVDLRKLTGAQRANAIKKFAEKLNALSIEERRKARFERLGNQWFEQMTEAERGEFLDATMPTGFKQMLTAFEQLPEEKRRATVEDALRRLRQEREKMVANGDIEPDPGGTNRVALSKELEAKVRTIGLKAFYSQSSAQTKAELAPVLEELQRVMESGRPFRRR